MVFSVDQVKELFWGNFPYADGFAWKSVERFELEDGVLQPYAGDDILPGPGIEITAELISL